MTKFEVLGASSNLNPCNLALLTNSILSGDIPIYSSFCILQSWQRAKAFQNSSIIFSDVSKSKDILFLLFA